MASKQNVAQTLFAVSTPHRRHPHQLALLIFIFSLISAPAFASGKIFILPAGPVDTLQSFQVQAHSDGSVALRQAPPLTLHLDDGTRATYSDLLVLPGGDLLLAGGAGRGLVFFDPSGHEIKSLFDRGTISDPVSVAVSQYLGPNQPELMIFGDDTVGRVQTYDLIDRSYRSAYFFTSGSNRAQIARAIRLPDDRTAIAVNWPSLGVSALEIWSLEDTLDPQFTIHSAPMDRREADLLDPLLYPLRDLMAHIDGRLLATSRDRVAILDQDGTILWELDLADLDAQGAEIQSAVFLNSGLIAVATMQPNFWTSPHINNALFLIDPEAEEPLLDRSPPLEAAPLRLELAKGHGGTGTFDYDANVHELPTSDPSALHLDHGPQLTPTTFAMDDATVLEFTLTNDSDQPFMLRRTELRVSPDSCASLATDQPPQNLWWARPARTLDPDQSWAERAGLSPQSGNLTPGIWCAQLSLILRDGRRHPLGSPIEVELLPPSDGPSNPVEIEDLGTFDELPDDPNSRAPSLDDQNQGCACAGSPGGSPPLFYLFILTGLLLRRRPQLRRR